MNYKKIYIDLMLKAQSEDRKKLKRDDLNYIYYERHHIIPKCLGGDNSKENLVLLTAKEHFVAHKLLIEAYPGNKSFLYTVWMMSISSNHGRREYNSSRDYLRLKEGFGKLASKINTGRVRSQATRDKISNNQKGKKRGPCKEETKIKIAQSNSGKKKSAEHCANLSKSHTGKVQSVETRQKRSNTTKGTRTGKDNPMYGKKEDPEHAFQRMSSQRGKPKPILTCPHCGKSGGGSAMYRYHFDRCKQSPNYISEPLICPHCGKIGSNKSGMKRYHFENCKSKHSEDK